MHNKRRHNGMNGGGQHRHQGNRPRRFGSGGRPQGSGNMDDPANVARTRRNAVQQREKYQMMARDALSMGDRVLAENHLQHADHYHRILLSLPPEEVRQPYQQRDGQSNFSNGGEQRPQGNAADSNGNQGEPMQASHALPQFITQPSGMPEGPVDE